MRKSSSNDVMMDAAVKRFVDGMSCSDISRSIGISESHARNLSNMALDIFSIIHQESAEKLREYMHSRILQIDGIPDSEFSMIVAVRDSMSGFTLWSGKCFSESYESILSVLKEVKEMFGDPSGAVSDMRQGIISALDETFPNIPRRVCLFHFFRDLGSDLMKTIHLELGRRINSEGMKSQLKRLIRSIPSYSSPASS
ncbi:MAG: hypothetical protein ACP5NO_08215 [Thermoplasmata archaeon]